MKTFILSDESVNRYGFRVLTGGIDLEHFEKNPVMLWSHTRTQGNYEDVILPIGIWKNLRIEDRKLLGEPCFDMDDKFAAKIAKKVEKGYINAASIGIEILELSDALEDIISGQTRKTVKRSELLEVSLTDIPANANSVSLYDGGNIIELTANGVNSAIGLIINKNQIKNEQNMKLIALKLGLSENATEVELLAKVQELQELQTKLTEMGSENATLKASAQDVERKMIEKMVNDAILAKKLTVEQKGHFVSIGEKIGVDALQTTLTSLNAAVRPADILSGVSGTQGGTGKKWADLSAVERETLRKEDTDTYSALFVAEYGFTPEL
jgi:HK97 family phage prohead protease